MRLHSKSHEFNDASNGETPLHSAIILDRREMVSFLIEKGANVNAIAKYVIIIFITSDGATPLEKAINWNDDTSLIMKLIDSGADLNLIDVIDM